LHQGSAIEGPQATLEAVVVPRQVTARRQSSGEREGRRERQTDEGGEREGGWDNGLMGQWISVSTRQPFLGRHMDAKPHMSATSKKHDTG
jgi:hypothetical protein